MSDGHTTKNVLLRGSAVSVSASGTNTEISDAFRISGSDSLYFQAQVQLSAAVVTTGITAKLQHSPNGGTTWLEVGSSGQAAAVQKTATLGTAEVTTTTWPAMASAAQGDYLHVTAQDGTTFAVWLDIDAAGTAPTGALYVAADEKIEVDIVTGDTAAQVATKVRAALVANAAWVAAFTTGAVATASITVTQLAGGDVANMAPKSENDGGAGSITIVVDAAGANGGINLSTEAITSSSHGFITGDRVLVSTAGTLPTGLSTGEYWVIKVDANTIKLASTFALAVAGTAVDISTYGVGTLRLAQADYTIRMLATDSTDVAQLPIWPLARLVVDSGASDSATVSAVWISRRL